METFATLNRGDVFFFSGTTYIKASSKTAEVKGTHRKFYFSLNERVVKMYWSTQLNTYVTIPA